MNPADLQPHELMQRAADFFESLGIAYRVVGSMASMAYGEPRLTIDIDIVADLKLEHVASLCATFAAPVYYFSEAAVREAIAKRFQFNIIHPASGLKVDVFIPKNTEFARTEANRVQRICSEGEYDAWFGSPEDVLLRGSAGTQNYGTGVRFRAAPQLPYAAPSQRTREEHSGTWQFPKCVKPPISLKSPWRGRCYRLPLC